MSAVGRIEGGMAGPVRLLPPWRCWAWPLRTWKAGRNWPEGLYFAFISGLTIGYGDLVPKRAISRFLAVGIGVIGVLLEAMLVAAIAVRALNAVQSQDPKR